VAGMLETLVRMGKLVALKKGPDCEACGKSSLCNLTTHCRTYMLASSTLRPEANDVKFPT
jgi:hypothetical protein